MRNYGIASELRDKGPYSKIKKSVSHCNSNERKCRLCSGARQFRYVLESPSGTDSHHYCDASLVESTYTLQYFDDGNWVAMAWSLCANPEVCGLANFSFAAHHDRYHDGSLKLKALKSPSWRSFDDHDRVTCSFTYSTVVEFVSSRRCSEEYVLGYVYRHLVREIHQSPLLV